MRKLFVLLLVLVMAMATVLLINPSGKTTGQVTVKVIKLEVIGADDSDEAIETHVVLNQVSRQAQLFTDSK